MNTRRTSSSPLPRGTHVAMAAITLATAAAAPAQGQPIGGDGFASTSAVAAIVKVPTPWYAPRFVVAGKMRDTIAQYAAARGLAFKAYSFAQADGHFGGVYLWKDLASARTWFAPAWFERVAKERGAPGEVRFFEVLAAIDNTPGGTQSNSDSPAVATLSSAPIPAGTSKTQLAQQFQNTLANERQNPSLLRRYYVVTDAGQFGHISIWRDAASARQWLNGAGATAGASPGKDAVVEWFDTPILLANTQAENQPRIPGL